MTFTRKPSWSEALLGAINHALGYLNVRDAAVDDVAATAYTTAAVAATKTTALTGDHNDLTYTAAVAGDAGNDITVEYVDPGDISQALTVEAGAGSTVIVNLATDGDGLITSTAEDIRAAVMAEAAITVFCTVALAPGNTGAGVVTEMAATNLEGGVDAIPHSGVRTMLWDAESNEIGASNPLPVEISTAGGNTLVGTEFAKMWDNNDLVNTLGRPATGQAGTAVAITLPTDRPAGGDGDIEIYNPSTTVDVTCVVRRKVTLASGTRYIELTRFTVPKASATEPAVEGKATLVSGLFSGEGVSLYFYNAQAVGAAATFSITGKVRTA